MNDSNDHLITLLAELDPAPAGPLTESERSRSETLLRSIVASPQATGADPLRRSPRRNRFVLAGALAAAATVVAVGVAAPRVLNHLTPPDQQSTPYLSSASLASWTRTATPLVTGTPAATAAEQWCLNGTAAGGGGSVTPQITNADVRGTVSSMLITRGGFVSMCLVASDQTGLWTAIAAPDAPSKAVAAGTISLETAGAHGDGSTAFTYAEGIAGSDVTSVTLADGGKTIEATVQDGRWTAWWPSTTANGEVAGPVTIGLADGSSLTIPAGQLKG